MDLTQEQIMDMVRETLAQTRQRIKDMDHHPTNKEAQDITLAHLTNCINDLCPELDMEDVAAKSRVMMRFSSPAMFVACMIHVQGILVMMDAHGPESLGFSREGMDREMCLHNHEAGEGHDSHN